MALDATTLSSAIVFPGWVAVPPGAQPLVLLAATAPLNPDGVAIVAALPTVCDAYATVGSPHQCNRGRGFVVAGRQYFYLGT
ncbi:MAG: hypothetical protein WCP77_12005, partial [Roseococcus sp.]